MDMMNAAHYIGSKLVKAQPMTRLEYNEYRGWDLPQDENGADEGYLVEYQDGGPRNHPDHSGYISWSPKAQFDAGYAEIGHLDGMPAHVQRVYGEEADLAKRLGALRIFMSGPRFDAASPAHQDLLAMQADAMDLLGKILNMRLALFRQETGQ